MAGAKVRPKAAAEASSVSTTRSAKSSGGEAEVAMRKCSAPARMISAEEAIAACASDLGAAKATWSTTRCRSGSATTMA